MTQPISSLEVTNYGCIRGATLALSPLHAFIGPNDSGKSTALRALRTVAQFAGGTFGADPNNKPMPFDPQLEPFVPGGRIVANFGDGLSYGLETTALGVVEFARQRDQEIARLAGSRGWNNRGLLHQGHQDPNISLLGDRLRVPAMLRLDPDALRAPSRQILAHEPIELVDERGTGLAAVYQAINNRDVDAFVALRDKAREFFPTLKTLRPVPISAEAVAFEAELRSGTVIRASAMSEGLLYFLAFAAIPYLRPTNLFLVEEPENGLHPARITEVMRVLRDVSERAQVVIATHSPFVVNELTGGEISVVTRSEQEGSRATLLKDTPNFEERKKVYALGELWVSYANGSNEAPLFTQPEAAGDPGEEVNWVEPADGKAS